ncbi:MAG: TIGR02147 family protein [Bacteriovoracia bacterium]
MGPPNVFHYHDYQAFFIDWIRYLTREQKAFTLKEFCLRTGISAPFLSLLLANKRRLTKATLDKTIGQLQLTIEQQRYLRLLEEVGTAPTQGDRGRAYQRLRRYHSYRKLNPKEIEVHQYLTKWYYVAIREMAEWPDFRLDAVWIQKHLRKAVPLVEVKKAIGFLTQHGFIQVDEETCTVAPPKRLDCEGGVYRLSMSQFYSQMMGLAVESLDTMTKQERTLSAYTLNIAKKDFDKVKAILNRAIEEVAELGQASSAQEKDATYQIGVFGVPLAERKDPGNDTDSGSNGGTLL